VKRYYPESCGIVLCLVLGLASGLSTQAGLVSWYPSLIKPALNPPAYVFGPVWTVLYVMIGIAAGRLWRVRHAFPTIWRLFLLQLVFNFAWTPLFFGLQRIDLALLDLLVLWLSLVVLLTLDRHSRQVFYWVFPYFLWVSFAAYLNVSLYVLNTSF